MQIKLHKICGESMGSEQSEDDGNKKGKVTFSIDKNRDFPDWYDRAVEVGDIIDNRYPVKGMYIWKPYGYKALSLMLDNIRDIMDKSGHEEVYFPMLIPSSVFEKEKDFLKGFKGEAYIVTKAGNEKLGEELYVRPTSETGMYESVRLWIRSAADLPLKLYQIVNVFRHETKQTHPMLRVREIAKFKEAHTFHATAGEAEKQIQEGINAYKEFFDRLCIPYIIVKTPKWDTFSGAEYNFDFLTVMPDGKAIELASVINLGNKFAKAYDLTYQNKDNVQTYVYQTCYGISERGLGVFLSIHGDNDGLVFTPQIAPKQVVIIPILKKGNEEKVLKKAEEIKRVLEKDFRTAIDIREKGIGDKYYEWEAKGVPVRIELGIKEVEAGKLVLFRRDTKEKTTVNAENAANEIKRLLESITSNMKERANEYFKNRVLSFGSVDELKEKYAEKGGMVSLPWCEDEKCAKELEEKVDIPILGFVPEKNSNRRCALCGKEAKMELFFGRTY